MKKTLTLLVVTALGFSSVAQQKTFNSGNQVPQTQKPAPTMQTAGPVISDVSGSSFSWSEETFDFGSIPQGTPVTHVFEFTNTGNQPLVISTVDKSCGCTTPKWTTEPVLPGKKGTVSATYNAATIGGFNKTITVHSNALGGDKVLYIKGTVVEAPQQQNPSK
jgi:hypothetical protein